MKIALAQINTHTGNFEFNRLKIIEYTQKAIDAGADLVVFPELSISGYPPRDFLDFDDFTMRCINEVDLIAPLSDKIGIILGSPVFNKSGRGKLLFNAALFLYQGKVYHQAHKALLPNYDIFDEYRYFEPGSDFNIVDFKGKKLALTICEDLWNIEGSYLYKSDPMEVLSAQHPDMIINIAASPFNYNQAEKREEVLQFHAKRYAIPVIYVNMVGAQTELIFDGDSTVMLPSGNKAVSAPFFEESLVMYDSESMAEEEKKEKPKKIELIHDALVVGIREYFRKLGFKKAILGLSGGIDSAIVAVLAAEALGAENVLALMLPSQFSSDHSLSDSEALVKNTGIKAETISIEQSFDAALETLKPYFDQLPFNIAEENLQARIRAVLLMAFSNKFGHILLNTSNKSEAAVGYGTLYGDMCGGLGIIGDLYKTQVYDLAHYINRSKEIIPQNIITKAPSAELRPNQKDSDSLPDYEILDKILFLYIEQLLSPHEIVAKGYDKPLVDRVLKLVNTNEYKRFQAPPILRISPKAFGFGRRMPIEAKYLS